MICVGVLGRTSIPKLINILVFACLLCVPPLNSWQKKKSKIRCTSNTWAEFDSRHVLCSEKENSTEQPNVLQGLASPCISINTQRLGEFLIWPYAESEVEYTMCINTAWSYKAPTLSKWVINYMYTLILRLISAELWACGSNGGKRTTPSCNPYS